ncbi:MAG: hypothetical protein FVQ82_05060 [Planctomycetes bacterium]|nr:hypothetical protein [Planctomycetota bacterium]
MTDVGVSPMTADQLGAFLEAASIWEAKFSDPVTVHINIAFDSLPFGVLGSTGSARTTHSYTSVRAALIADASTPEQATINSMPISSLPIKDISGDRSDSLITMTTANAKALGLGTGLDTLYTNPPTGVDAEMKFSTSFASTFDYITSDGIDAGKTDFVGVATHEIGHALGFVSLTDIQDANPDYVLHPSVLDFYRFFDLGFPFGHAMATDRRRTLAGPAEYSDLSPSDKVPFSYGSADSSDPACDSVTGSCQASHWRDDQGLLMDPTLGRGIRHTIKTKDMHAFDFIGWNRQFLILRLRPIRMFRLGWFFPYQIPDIPHFDGAFDDSASLPSPDSIQWPANENEFLALRAAFDLGFDGGKRSGLGYARFLPNTQIDPKVIVPPFVAKEQQDLYPIIGEPATVIPANLRDVFIQSDMEGVPFSFKSSCGVNGCPFDPTLGEFGGYRIPGIIDGQGDQKTGDADAIMTLIMLAPDPSGIPDPDKNNIFESDSDNEDNNIIILDPEAIGAILPPECGDANHPIPLASLNGDCIVNIVDFALFAEQWLLCTDPLCP